MLSTQFRQTKRKSSQVRCYRAIKYQIIFFTLNNNIDWCYRRARNLNRSLKGVVDTKQSHNLVVWMRSKKKQLCPPLTKHRLSYYISCALSINFCTKCTQHARIRHTAYSLISYVFLFVVTHILRMYACKTWPIHSQTINFLFGVSTKPNPPN